MNNREQNVNPDGTPQNHHPNQGYPQQNNQYQENGYNGQNPQNFNRNINNQNPYQNQNLQANNVNNPQFQGYSNSQNQPQNNMNNSQYRGQGYNAQSPQNNNMNNPQYRGQGYNAQSPQNNMNNPQYRGQGYNAQSPQNNMNNPQYRAQGYNGQNSQYNNMNNQQYRGQGNNGQNPKFGNPNNPQFSYQNGYNNPNQFNPQFGNNQNFNPMNRGPKMDSKMIGYITAAVAAILVVLMIFMFSSGSGKLGGATPEEAVKNAISATKDGDFKKLVNNIYFESDEARTKALEEFNNLTDGAKNALKTFSDIEIGEVKSINENRAKVKLKFSGDTTKTIYVKKVNGRWFIEDN